jgi:HD superfamily phosphohydrolase YqeK
MDYTDIVDHLDQLVRDTCALWGAGWVTFNWRGYTYDHVRRVRGLALTIVEGESGPANRQGPGHAGELRVVELASLLHDITKPYDGEYMTDASGRRLVDGKGYWRNDIRQPLHRNEVTDIYGELGLSGQLHHESGATVAYHLLRRSGLDEVLAGQVAQAIRDHLQPGPDASMPGRCLYDADTIDANIGLPAFIRNIYINSHFYELRKGPGTPSLEMLLRENPLSYLEPYVLDKLPAWSEGKERDFIPRLLTNTAQQVARNRLARLRRTWASLAEELQAFDWHRSHGRLAVLLHFMYHTDDPSIAAETRYLADQWVATNGATPQARELLAQMECEMAGAE